MKTLIKTLFFCLLGLHIAIGQWHRIDNFPKTNSLRSVKFIDINNVWAIGDNGTVINTTNGGFVWNDINIGTNKTLRSFYAIDENNYWIAGDDGALVKTTDSGLHWVYKNPINWYHFKQILFTNINIGWAVGFTGTHGFINRTTNGGEDWISFYSYGKGFNAVDFMDSQYGWVVRGGHSNHKTTDGGLNWSTFQTNYSDYYSIKSFDQYSGITVGRDIVRGGYIYKYFSGGASGQEKFSSTAIESFNSICFYNQMNGWTVGSKGTIFKTINGGDTWLPRISGTTNNLNSVDFIDDNNGFAVGEYGMILKSTDGGENWINITKESIRNINSVFFTNNHNGWAVGEDGSNSFGKILKTTNGGLDWESLVMNSNGPLNAIFFINENIGWAAGSGGKIYYTTDSGFNWLFSNLDSLEEKIDAIHFTNMQNGWAVGSNTILKTNDGGLNWLKQPNDTLGVINSVYFVDSEKGYMVGRKNCGWWCSMATIYHTVDGGNTWYSQLQDTISANLSSVFFIDEYRGWTVGDNLILHTSNGGTTWVKQSNDTSYYSLRTVHFTNINNGYIAGAKILKTNNGGIDWIEQESGTDNYLNSIFFIDTLTGWAVGDNGTILHTTNGGVTFLEEEKIAEKPREFLLSQNYPNPFNPSTSIQYSVSSRQFIKLTVYDLLGREVETLVNEEKAAGIYEITWYAENLPSGIYFYQLCAGEYTSVKKMILIK